MYNNTVYPDHQQQPPGYVPQNQFAGPPPPFAVHQQTSYAPGPGVPHNPAYPPQQPGYPPAYQQQPGSCPTHQTNTSVVVVSQPTVAPRRRNQINHPIHLIITIFFWPWALVWLYLVFVADS